MFLNSIDIGASSVSSASHQSIVLGASRDSAKRPISAFMPLCRFLLADRLAPEALRPLESQLLFGDPLRFQIMRGADSRGSATACDTCIIQVSRHEREIPEPSEKSP